VSKSDLELAFDFQLRAAGLPALEQEVRFHSTRRWKFDRADTARKIAFEIEGGIFSQGRHTRGTGFMEDCEKYNEAALLGWRVYRIPGPWIIDAHGRSDGRALAWAERVLRGEGLDNS